MATDDLAEESYVLTDTQYLESLALGAVQLGVVKADAEKLRRLRRANVNLAENGAVLYLWFEPDSQEEPQPTQKRKRLEKP